MTAHELAQRLLDGPDLPVIIVTGEPPYPVEVTAIDTPEDWTKGWFSRPALELS